MSTTETTKSLQGYMSIPIAQLTESNTNPRKVFDAAKLKELVASIRSKGSLVVRRVNGYLRLSQEHDATVPLSGRA
jgi:hypothetical protein